MSILPEPRPVYILLLYVCLSGGCSRDPVMAVYSASGSSKVTLRSNSEWEKSVPIYLEVSTPGGWHAVSGNFYYCDPQVLDSSSLPNEIRVENGDNFFLVWSTEDEDTILAIVDASQQLVYPPNNVRNSSYYEQIDDLLSTLKRLRHNDRLRLQR